MSDRDTNGVTIEPMRVSDYFAELYVAGRFADAGWNVYFPHRDQGFDFIATKAVEADCTMIRPVQVKGKYPMSGKGDKPFYGYTGPLTMTHQDMVLAIPYFIASANPVCVAYMPFSQIKCKPDGETFRCWPATLRQGRANPRRDFKQYFDENGLRLLESLPAANLT